MADGFNIISRKGRKKSIETWNPKHQSGVFDVTSLPANRANQTYEIKGLTIPSLDIFDFTVNNGDIVVFNSAGTLIEILGDEPSSNTSGGDGISITEWIPTVGSGQYMRWNGITFNFNPVCEAFTTEGDTVITIPTINNTDETIGVVSSVYPTLSNFEGKSGVTFLLPNPQQLNEAYFYLGFFSEGTYPTDEISSAAAVIMATNTGYQIQVLGNPFTGVGGVNDFGGTPIDLTFDELNEIEISIVYDPDFGDFGEVSIYSSNVINDVVATHEFTSSISDALFQIGCLVNMSYSEGVESINLGIQNSPIVVHTDFINLAGGMIDTTVLPLNRAGTFSNVSGLSSPAYYPGKGFIQNGDLVGWNLNGDMAGVLIGRNEYSETFSRLETLVEYRKSMFGAIHFTPEMITSAISTFIEYQMDGGSNAIGMDATSPIDTTNEAHTTLYRTDKLITGSGPNLRGMFFTLPSNPHSDIDVSTWHFGYSDYNIDGYYVPSVFTPGVDINSIKLTLNYSNSDGWTPSIGYQPGLQIKNNGNITLPYFNFVNGDITLNSSHCYFLGFSNTALVFANLVTGQALVINADMNFAINQNIEWCWTNAYQVNHSMFMTHNVNTKIPNLSFLGTLGFTDNGYTQFDSPLITKEIDANSKPANCANKSVQWVNLPTDAFIYGSNESPISIANNSVVLYNSEEEIISIIQGF